MNALEFLAKLRAAGVEPLDATNIELIVDDVREGRRGIGEFAVRLAADLLEARAKLEAVREWAESPEVQT